MKQLLLVVFFFFGVHFSGYGQTNPYFQNMNFISWNEFTHISFNGITLGSIMQTKGDTTKVNALFGKTMQYRKSDDPNYYWINFWNDDVSFTFDESSTSPAALSNFEVDGKQVAVKIGDEVIHLGDSIDKLGNVKIYKGLNSGTKFILFLPQASDGQSLRIDFNQETRIITKITYTAT